jgi:hypothetical protein
VLDLAEYLTPTIFSTAWQIIARADAGRAVVDHLPALPTALRVRSPLVRECMTVTPRMMRMARGAPWSAQSNPAGNPDIAAWVTAEVSGGISACP